MAQHRLGLTLDSEGKALVIEGGQTLCLLVARDPDQARAPAGQGHQREGPVAGVELGRGFPVLAVMGQDHRDGGLRIGPGSGADARDLAQPGVPPIRRGHEAGADSGAVGQGEGRSRVVRREAGREFRDQG